MIVSGPRIRQLVEEQGVIEPFDERLLNPSSYDLTLGEECCVYTRGTIRDQGAVYVSGRQLPDPPGWLDTKQPNAHFKFRMYASFRVDPGRIYLMHTAEVIAPGLEHVAVIDGKSSLGRLGLVVHATAGYVDPGFRGQITLEIAALGESVVLHPGMRIAQVRFQPLHSAHLLDGRGYESQGHYVGEASRGPVPSRSYLQFSREPKTDPVPPPAECQVCSRDDCDNPNGKH